MSTSAQCGEKVELYNMDWANKCEGECMGRRACSLDGGSPCSQAKSRLTAAPAVRPTFAARLEQVRISLTHHFDSFFGGAVYKLRVTAVELRVEASREPGHRLLITFTGRCQPSALL